ncbi:uncharacterized protein [Diabrotica undecimpunctata]|uniref:uncharacterized protein n=1 Tax=Diabrotica undecimpunctata TaxID=50387 RepID=UPI003B638FC4
MWDLEHHNLLIPEQAGFRPLRSTIDNVLHLESQINEAFCNKQKCVAVYFDIHKAFDLAWRHRILTKLQTWGIQGNMLAFLNNFLHERKFSVRSNGEISSIKSQDNGTPQGSILKLSNIKEIKSIGRNRIKILVNSHLDANELVNNKSLKEHNLRAYIPNHLLEVKGLVRDVDTRCQITPPSVIPREITIHSTNNEKEFLLEPLNITELEYALKNRNNSSPGLDNIKYPMIQFLPKIAKLFLLDIFNDIIINNSVIHAFKDVIIIPILKPGKNPNLSESYRPISLMSCLLKTLERMIKHRLEWYLDKKKLLPDLQFGYKKGCGTTDALATLVTDIQDTFSNNTYLPTICLDIQGAYNNVCLDILMEKSVN